MAKDLALVSAVDANNPTINDLRLDANGQLEFISGIEAVAQHLRVRLKHFAGEWFLDTSEGIPYMRSVFIKIQSTAAVQSMFRRVIQGTPGITAVHSVSVQLDTATRIATVDFDATTDGGETLTSDDFGPFVVEI